MTLNKDSHTRIPEQENFHQFQVMKQSTLPFLRYESMDEPSIDHATDTHTESQ